MNQPLIYTLVGLVAIQFGVILFLLLDRRRNARNASHGTPGVLDAPLGITAIAGGEEDFFVVVPAGQQLPHTYSETYTTQYADQDRVEVAVSQKTRYGLERIVDLRMRVPLRPPGTSQVTVTLKIDERKQLAIKLTAIETGEVKEYGPFPVE